MWADWGSSNIVRLGRRWQTEGAAVKRYPTIFDGADMQFNNIGFVGGELVSSFDVELVGFTVSFPLLI